MIIGYYQHTKELPIAIKEKEYLCQRMIDAWTDLQPACIKFMMKVLDFCFHIISSCHCSVFSFLLVSLHSTQYRYLVFGINSRLTVNEK